MVRRCTGSSSNFVPSHADSQHSAGEGLPVGTPASKGLPAGRTCNAVALGPHLLHADPGFDPRVFVLARRTFDPGGGASVPPAAPALIAAIAAGAFDGLTEAARICPAR